MRRIACLLIICLTLSFSSVFGTHLRAGEIVVTQTNCGQRTFLIKLILYGNAGPVFPTPGGQSSVFNLGDGTSLIIPDGTFQTRPDLPLGVGVFTFTVEHKYPRNGFFVISYSEPNRNFGVLNMDASGNTLFYTETRVAVGAELCNSLPVLLAPPIDQACSGLTFFHNPGAFDTDGDSLSFKLVVPYSGTAFPVTNYRAPNHRDFYMNPDFGNEEGTGPPLFTMNAFDGTIVWDAPGAIGQYNIAFVVEEWRKIDGVFYNVGSVRRDMQIIVQGCDNQRPDLIVPEDICVVAGTTISESIFGTDPDGHDVKIEIFSGIFSFTNNPAIASPHPPTFQSSVPKATLSFEWTPSCEEVRNQPYLVTVKITDNPALGVPLVRFKTWSIKVVAPAPDLTNAQVDILQRHANVSWAPYVCTNATAIQVWRRVGTFPYNPDNCVSGLPKFAGYKKVGDVLPGQLEFTDTNEGKGLAPGAVYCYRLTAIFPLVGGAESKVSVEICLPPILAEAPVITNVTVDKTHEAGGQMTISWRSPYDLDVSEYLKPYEYALLRATGLTGDNDLTSVQLTNILDTTYTDTGLDTKNFAYNYRIILLAQPSAQAPIEAIDTSARASSVWNEVTPLTGQIKLDWEAVTPWSNFSPDHPRHLIYRSSETGGLENLVLIDSVDVLETGFSYLDVGSFQNAGLDDQEFYCYRIKTRGTYGNSEIAAPQENYSQLICSTTLDVVPPCAPLMTQTAFDCDLFNSQTPCSQTAFAHTIHWEVPEVECVKDVYRYKVYASDDLNENFEVIGFSSEYEFTEGELPSLKRCYKVTSVDRAGNESEFSETICFDNCPSISFPNVFTPNDDLYNQYFINFNDDQSCMRFVRSISLSVFNRWGGKIIELNGEVPLLWDGKDSNGKQVARGVYYFKADVLVDVLDSSSQKKEMKGWIHVAY
jgi:gliding motility-associated-like protein